MAFVITQSCIDTTDQACVEVCPVDCIHFEQGADRMLYINPAECIDCGACQPACPVQAIFPEGDVPGEMQKFIGINAQWYSDPAAARAQVGGAPAGGAAPTPRPAAEAAPAAAPAEEAPAPTAVVTAHTSQVSAIEDHHSDHPVVPHYNLPSPMGFATAVGMLVGFVIMFTLPGPRALILPGVGDVGIGQIAGVLIALFFLGGFLQSQISDLGLFAAAHERERESWRHAPTIWRRSEESRRFWQERAVKSLAETRFGFPTIEHPDYRTHVNVPNPTMALEFGGGGGEKVYPDILVVQYPGNYPVMVAQIETGETVTREQAKRVWKQLESEEAPLYIYVPSGYGTVAKDYARSAGIKHAEVRTWARVPEGVLVREV